MNVIDLARDIAGDTGRALGELTGSEPQHVADEIRREARAAGLTYARMMAAADARAIAAGEMQSSEQWDRARLAARVESAARRAGRRLTYLELDEIRHGTPDGAALCSLYPA